MHEVSIVSGIIDAVLKELENHNVKKVDEVNLILGDMTSLGEEQMMFAYDVMVKGTKLEGSVLKIEREEVNLKCDACGFEGPAKTLQNDFYNHIVPIISCPKCNGKVEITSGQSCRISSITAEEED